MLHAGRFQVLLLAAFLLVMGTIWWSTQPRFPVNRPAAEMVLQQADLQGSFVPLEQESGEIPANPYEDETEHFRSGFRAIFVGKDESEWKQTRLVSTTFVVDRQGAERIFDAYVAQTRNRGELLSLPPLGEQSHFLVATNEASAPVVVVGTVRVQNVLITLTVMTDQNLDPALVYGWARVIVDRIATR